MTNDDDVRLTKADRTDTNVGKQKWKEEEKQKEM